jgi:hypothetical protein
MYNLYRLLKDRDEPPTPDETAIASGKKVLDAHTEVEHLKMLEMSTDNIKKAFENQKTRAIVSNQFCTLMLYLFPNRDHGTKKNSSISLPNGSSPVTSPSVKLKKPSSLNCWTMHITVLVHWRSRNVIQSSDGWWGWVRKRLRGSVKCFRYSNLMLFLLIRLLIVEKKLEGKVSLSLDAWTSSNQFAFLAIVAHYVTNEGELGKFVVPYRNLERCDTWKGGSTVIVVIETVLVVRSWEVWRAEHFEIIFVFEYGLDILSLPNINNGIPNHASVATRSSRAEGMIMVDVELVCKTLDNQPWLVIR